MHFPTLFAGYPFSVLSPSVRYSIVSGNERMTFTMDARTGVLSLSDKRRQGLKLSYQLNVSVSDGVFTSTAQVRRLVSTHPLCILSSPFTALFRRNTVDVMLTFCLNSGTRDFLTVAINIHSMHSP